MPNVYASKWEEEYASYLQLLKLSGEIASWEYEPDRFELAPRTTYTPDFKVAYHNGVVEYVEVKGRQREDAMVKFKVCAHQNPGVSWRMVRKTKGQWVTIRGYCFPSATTNPKHPVHRAVPVMTPRAPMTYAQMQKDPALAPILSLKPHSFHELRVRLNLAPQDMAERLGMTTKAWVNIESGQSKIYHHRHVLAVKRLLEAV